MTELMSVAVPLAVGLILGAIFFGGLWWTVNHALSSRQPVLWLIGSKLLRMGIALGGFYLVGGERLERWLLCLLGFVLARLVAWWLTRVPPVSASEARYAP